MNFLLLLQFFFCYLKSWIGSTIRWYTWYYCAKKEDSNSDGYWADVIGIHDQPIWVWWFSSIINNHKLWHRYYFIQIIFGRFYLLFAGSIVCCSLRLSIFWILSKHVQQFFLFAFAFELNKNKNNLQFLKTLWHFYFNYFSTSAV